MMDMVLRLTSPSNNSNDKQSIFLELSDSVRCLDDAKIAQSKRTSRYHQHLMNFHNEQFSFDTESCVLNELTADILGVMTKIGFMATSNRASMTSVEKQIQKCTKEGREHNFTMHELNQKVQRVSDSQNHFMRQQNSLPTPKKGFFTRDCAEAPNIFDI